MKSFFHNIQILRSFFCLVVVASFLLYPQGAVASTDLSSQANLKALLDVQQKHSHVPYFPWFYTALGDSIANGIGASPEQGYVYQYRNHLQTDLGTSVYLINLGISGWTSSDLLTALRTNRGFRNAVRYSKVVTWNIGSNDFLAARASYQAQTCGGADNQDCLRFTLATFKANWSAIITEIHSLRNPNRTIVRTTDLYNPLVNEDKAVDTWPNDAGNDFQVFHPYFDDINVYIASTAAANNIPVAKVSLAFNGANGETDPSDLGYIAADGVHPNDLGHQQIADLLQGLGYAPLY